MSLPFSIGQAVGIPTVVMDFTPPRQRLVLPAPPTANLYWRVYRGRAVKSAAARAYGQLVWVEARRQKAKPIPAPESVALEIEWTRAHKRGDLDNRLKVVLDALKGLAWADDKQIREIKATRLEGATDGIVVTWWAA